MKLNYYIVASLGIALAAGLCGCSVFDKSPKHVVQGSEGKVASERTEVTSDGPVLTPPKGNVTDKESGTVKGGSKAVKNKKQKGDGQAVSQKELAAARKEAAQGNTTGGTGETKGGNQESTVKRALPADFTINGEWTIYSVRGNVITGEERPYVNFDLAAKRFYGSNGCNYVNGNLSVEGQNDLRMDNMITTMKMCQDAPYEYLINLAVSDVRSYSARQEGPITFLDLKGADGRTILVLRRHNMDFLNGAWKITDLNGAPLVPADGEEPATMTINIPDMKIHGTTGCNIFNGTLFIDPDKVDSMQFINIITTRMGCPPGAHETEFLLGLEGVETAKSVGKDSIAMYSTDGKEIFKMVRIEMTQDEDM